MSKFAENFLRFNVIGFGCLFFFFEIPDMFFSTSRSPFMFLFVICHAAIYRQRSNLLSSISVIKAFCVPKIIDPIIRFYSVDMIHLMRKIAMMPKKNKSSGQIQSLFNANLKSSVSSFGPGSFVYFNSVCRRIFPNKKPRTIITKKIFNFIKQLHATECILEVPGCQM